MFAQSWHVRRKMDVARHLRQILEGSYSPAPPCSETRGAGHPDWQQSWTSFGLGDSLKILAERLVGPKTHDGQT